MEIDIKEIIEQSRKPCNFPIEFDRKFKPAILVPEGFNIEEIEHLLPAPVRKTAKITLNDAASFIDYTKKHGSLDNCTIYANTDFETQRAGLFAIINDNGSEIDASSWRDHTATYAPVKTVEWKLWHASNGKAMGQEEVATFLENNLGDIATVEGMPTGTDMLKMATDFEATADKKFKSKTNIQSGGVSLVFVDQDDAATEQAMRLFERFSLGLRVFLNGTPYRLDARLKYRLNGGKLSFWYELIRPDRVFEDAVKDEFSAIKDKTGFPLLYGSPGL